MSHPVKLENIGDLRVHPHSDILPPARLTYCNKVTPPNSATPLGAHFLSKPPQLPSMHLVLGSISSSSKQLKKEISVLVLGTSVGEASRVEIKIAPEDNRCGSW